MTTGTIVAIGTTVLIIVGIIATTGITTIIIATISRHVVITIGIDLAVIIIGTDHANQLVIAEITVA